MLERVDAELAGLFPSAVRRQPLSQLPQSVRDELSARGISWWVASKNVGPSTWGVHLSTAAGMLVLFIFVLALIVGIVTMASWVWARLGSLRA